MIPIITIVLSTIIAGIGWLLKNEIEKRREIEKQLSETKYNVYVSLIEVIFSIFENVIKKKDEAVPEEAIDKMFKIVQDLIIYGSDSVVKKFSQWKQLGSVGGEMTIILITEVIIEIRKDMGNQNTKMNIDHLWGMLISDYENIREKLKIAKLQYDSMNKNK